MLSVPIPENPGARLMQLLSHFRLVLPILCAVLLATPLAAQEREDWLQRAKRATAFVDLAGHGSGSAFCVDDSGLFITNRHVVESVGLGGIVRLVIEPAEKRETVCDARVVSFDPAYDLAMLKLTTGKTAGVLKLGNRSRLKETDPVSLAGYPFGRQLTGERARHYPAATVTTGKISAFRRTDDELEFVQIDASVNPGNSGGPVLNSTGEVIAVTTAMIPDSRIVFAIPVSAVQKLLERPGLVLTAPAIDYHQGMQPVSFDLSVTAATEAATPDAVELVLIYGDRSRRFKGEKRTGGFAFVAPPLPDDISTRLRLSTEHDGEELTAEIDDLSLQIGKKSIRLLEIRRIERRHDTYVITTVAGQKYAGTLSGLVKLSEKAGWNIEASTLDRIDVHGITAVPVQLDYEVVAFRKGERIASESGVLSIRGTPIPYAEIPTADDDPFASDVDRLVIEARIDGKAILHLAPGGLVWQHLSGEMPGDLTPAGNKIAKVNGHTWDLKWNDGELPDAAAVEAEQGVLSNAFLLKLGWGHWDMNILSVQATPESQNDRKRGKVELKEVDDYFQLTIDDSASGSALYRVCLTKRATMPEPPPRTTSPRGGLWSFEETDGPYIYSPGDDSRAGRIAGLPTRIPGRQGEALVLEQASLNAGPLADFERTDQFSYGAWIYPTAAATGAVISRMSSRPPHRGFDLYLDKLQIAAHLISAWDKDALRVQMVDRIPSDRWSHVLVTYDGSCRAAGVKIYLNGREAGAEITHDRFEGSLRSESPLRIGSRDGGHYTSAVVDDVRVYSRTLSADEARQLVRISRDPMAGSRSLDRDLVAHYPFDGGESEAFANRAKEGTTATLAPSQTVPVQRIDGKVGHALSLQSGGQVLFPPLGDFEKSDAFSGGAWVKPDDAGSMPIISRMQHVRPHRGYELRIEKNCIQFYLIHDFGRRIMLQMVSQPIIRPGEWQHVMFTYDGSGQTEGIQLYYNGQPVEATPVRKNLSGSIRNEEPLRLGYRAYLQFKGGLDEVFLLPRLVTDEEIAALAAGDRGLEEILRSP